MATTAEILKDLETNPAFLAIQDPQKKELVRQEALKNADDGQQAQPLPKPEPFPLNLLPNLPEIPSLKEVLQSPQSSSVASVPFGGGGVIGREAIRPREVPLVSEETVRQLSQVPIGATVGGMAGVAAGARFGPVAAESLGAAGAALGDQAQQGVNRLLGFPAPETATESLKQSVGEGALQAIFGFGARGGVRLAQSATQGLKKKLFDFSRQVTDEAKEVQPFLESLGSSLRPAEAVENAFLDILDNIARSAILGSRRIRDFAVRRQDLLESFAKNIVDRVGQRNDPAVTSRLILKALEGNREIAKLPAKAVRERVISAISPKVDPVTGAISPGTGSITNIRPLVLRSSQLNEIAESLNKIGSRFTADEVIRSIANLPERMQTVKAIQLRERLDDIIEPLAQKVGNKSQGLRQLVIFRKRLDRQITEALRAFDPAVADDFALSNRLFRTGERDLNNEVLRQLAQSVDLTKGGTPDALGQIIFQANSGQRARILRRALLLEGKSPGPGLTAEALQRARERGQRVLNMAARAGLQRALFDPTTGRLRQGRTVLNNLVGDSGAGRKTLDALLGKETADSAIRLARTIDLTQRKLPVGTGNVFIQLVQPGAAIETAGLLGTLLSSGSADLANQRTASALAITFVPRFLAGVFTNKEASDLMIKGLTTRNMSLPQQASLLSRILTLITERPEDQPGFTNRAITQLPFISGRELSNQPTPISLSQ